MKNCAIKSGAQAANLFLRFSWNWRKEIDFSNVIGEKWKKEKKLKLLFILYIGKKLWWKWFFFLLFLRIYFFLGKRETRFKWSLSWHLSESLWKIIWGLYVLKEIRFLKDNLGKTPAISVGKKKKKRKRIHQRSPKTHLASILYTLVFHSMFASHEFMSHGIHSTSTRLFIIRRNFSPLSIYYTWKKFFKIRRRRRRRRLLRVKRNILELYSRIKSGISIFFIWKKK